jgi:transposase
LLDADTGPDGPAHRDQALAEELGVNRTTVERIRHRFATHGLESAVHRKTPEREYRTKLTPPQKAQLIALAGGPPPVGHTRWTLQSLADHLVALGYVDSISHETIRRILKQATSSLG